MINCLIALPMRQLIIWFFMRLFLLGHKQMHHYPYKLFQKFSLPGCFIIKNDGRPIGQAFHFHFLFSTFGRIAIIEFMQTNFHQLLRLFTL